MRISIRKKVILVLIVYMVAGGVVWGLNYANNILINRKLQIIEKKEDLLNTILEARRYEKNYFLTFNGEHIESAVNYIRQAEDKLGDIVANDFEYLETPDIEKSRRILQEYAGSMDRLAEKHHSAGSTVSRQMGVASGVGTIRNLGREITEDFERMVQAERLRIKGLVRDAQAYHIVALCGMFAISAFTLLFFYRSVYSPLKTLEGAIGEFTSGNFDAIPQIPGGLEFESLVASLNRMLDMLKRRNQELIHTKKMASLGTLTSGVAHELNNPLNNISTSIQIILEELEEEDLEYKRELLEGAEKEVERARDIVRALLEFSRQRAFSIKPVVFKHLVDDTIKLVKGELPSNVSIKVEGDEGIRAALDSRRFQQVLLNLIVNGVQAMEEDGGTITIRSFLRGDNQFCFEVCDTGKGIPAKDLSKIFDPFFSTKEGTSAKNSNSGAYEGLVEQEGTGLGLAICHGIVKKHGGTIDVKSKEGEGTVFTVCLPIGRLDEYDA